MNELKTRLWDYFGQLNEIKQGISIKPEEKFEKPDALIRYELAQSLGVPYVDGGLSDQPWEWMKEHSVIVQFIQEWQAVETAQAKMFAQKTE